MELSEEDLERLNYLYKELLKALKREFISKNAINIKKCLGFIIFFYTNYLVPNNTDSTLLSINNLPSNGILSLCGYQVCRNTNAFLYDFLMELNLTPFFQYIYIDENNDWHIVNAISANHLVVSLNDGNSKLFLDLYNGIYFDSNLKQIITDNNYDINDLNCSKLIEEIRDIIDKYKALWSLGIKRVYSYKY